MFMIKKNIWNTDCDCICITTNGIVKNNGEVVWGAGIAKQAAKMWPDLPKIHGNFLKKNDHVFGYLIDVSLNKKTRKIFTFPTKFHWKNLSNIDLIKKSAYELFLLSNQEEYLNCSFAIPAPGCANGGLKYSDVFPELERILIGDRFIVYYI